MDLDLSGLSVRAVGTDLVDVGRIHKASQTGNFLSRVFSADELDYCLGSDRLVSSLGAQRLAVRFAAKEATLKALGTGLGGARFIDIEVIRHESGEPQLQLLGSASSLATTKGIDRWLVSLSHTTELAQAFVVGLSK